MGQLSVAFVLERCDLALEKHVTLPVAHVCALYTLAHIAYTFTHIIHAQLRGAYTYMIGTHNCTLECKLIMQVYSYHAHAHTHLSTTHAHLYNTLVYTICKHSTHSHSPHKHAEAHTPCQHTLTRIYTCEHTTDTHTYTHKHNTDYGITLHAYTKDT